MIFLNKKKCKVTQGFPKAAEDAHFTTTEGPNIDPRTRDARIRERPEASALIPPCKISAVAVMTFEYNCRCFPGPHNVAIVSHKV